MVKSKSAELGVLSQLQLSEEEMMASYYYSQNVVMDPDVANSPYSDNMALLFHSSTQSLHEHTRKIRKMNTSSTTGIENFPLG